MRLLLVASLVTASFVPLASPAAASSDFATGALQRRDPATGADLGLGICRLFIGPRDFVEAGEFLLRIGDDDVSNGYELELNGTAVPDGDGGFLLSADGPERGRVLPAGPAPGAQAVEVRLQPAGADRGGREDRPRPGRRRHHLRPPPAGLDPRRHDAARVAVPVVAPPAGGGPHGLTGRRAVPRCRYVVRTGVSAARPPRSTRRPAAPPATTASTCPQPNFTPLPAKCGTPNCMVTFAGYQWWTEYNFFPPPTYFFNNNNAWAPKNVTVDAEGTAPLRPAAGSRRRSDVGGGRGGDRAQPRRLARRCSATAPTS